MSFVPNLQALIHRLGHQGRSCWRSDARRLGPVWLTLFCTRAFSQEQTPLVNWSQVSDSVGIPALVAFVMSAAFVFILSRNLRREVGLRRQVEVDADDERSRLNAILNNAGVGVLITERNQRVVDVNNRWCQMFGYRRNDVRGALKVADVAHPDEADSLDAHFRALQSGRIKSQTQECRFARKDGSVFWGLISTSTVEGRKGRRKWVVGMITDIDAQKKVEEELRESEERLRFITENTHDVVWQLDRDLRVTYINGADERMRGFGRDEVIDQPFRDMIVPTSYPVFDQAMQRFPESGVVESMTDSFEVEMRCKDGNRVWAEINLTHIHDNTGQIIGYIGVTRDATQRRQMQEILREQTIRDPLTGLFNRRYMDESLERELSRAARDKLPLSLLMIDIDHFKKLNDTYGHQAGDEVLKRLGELIRHGARSADLPCRYGGEEFLLVLPNMSLDKAVERAEEWRQAFAAARVGFGGTLLSATMSVGVATFPEHGNARESLIEAADRALYAAKHAGRNRVVIASVADDVCAAG